MKLAWCRNIMLVGIGVGITASFGFHISVKESSDHHNVEQFKLSSIEVRSKIKRGSSNIYPGEQGYCTKAECIILAEESPTVPGNNDCVAVQYSYLYQR